MAVIADIPEVIGFAIALQILFGLSLVYGILIAAAATIVGLSITSWGVRPLEGLIAVLLAIMVACCVAQNVAIVSVEKVRGSVFLFL